ncbi:MAG: 4'-phosphopantetheinyl transferase superfamily protein [Verrucomicrobiota bacterium]
MTNQSSLWNPAPPDLRALAPGVHVFRFDLEPSPERLQSLASTLADDEWRRARRFHFGRDRDRFVAARGQLREILAARLRRPAASIELAYGRFGKPSLAGIESAPADRQVHFNLAHSDARALVALSHRPVGVDIERKRPLAEMDQIAARFFAPNENARLQSRPVESRPEAFFDLWTRKEAWVKANGWSLAEGMNQVELPQNPDPASAAPSSRAPAWRIEPLQPGDDYAGAVAFLPGSEPVRCWEWT